MDVVTDSRIEMQDTVGQESRGNEQKSSAAHCASQESSAGASTTNSTTITLALATKAAVTKESVKPEQNHALAFATNQAPASDTSELLVTGGAITGAAARPFSQYIEGSSLPLEQREYHEHFMSLAIDEAQKAEALGEVPVGAVLVDAQGRIVATGFNRTISDHDASAHAEIVAMRQAGQKMQNYRLPELTLYVTLEPCCMCIMAAIHARIATVVFGTSDPRTGACGSVFNISGDPRHNHHVEVIAHIRQEECAAQLRAFFKQRRAAQKDAKRQAKEIKSKFEIATAN